MGEAWLRPQQPTGFATFSPDTAHAEVINLMEDAGAGNHVTVYIEID